MPVILKSSPSPTITIKKPLAPMAPPKTVAPPPKAKITADAAKQAGDSVVNRERAIISARRVLEVEQELAKVQAEIVEKTKELQTRQSELSVEKAELDTILIQDLCDGLAPHQKATVQLEETFVEISKEKEFREVFDKQLAKELLGDQVFWASCTIPLKIIDDYLVLKDRLRVTTSHFNGKRTVKVGPFIK